MPGPRDIGGHLMKMRVLWYDDCTVDLQGLLTICTHVRSGRGGTTEHTLHSIYSYGRDFVSMQYLGQSKVTSRSLQGQTFINSNNILNFTFSYGKGY